MSGPIYIKNGKGITTSSTIVSGVFVGINKQNPQHELDVNGAISCISLISSDNIYAKSGIIVTSSGGVDQDKDLIYVSVTGGPKLSWKENEDLFYLNKSLSITGDESIDGNINISGNININTKLISVGDAFLTNELYVNNSLTVSGVGIFGNDVVMCGDIAVSGIAIISTIKSGSTQITAGAIPGELWRTAGHATLPNNVLMIGI